MSDAVDATLSSAAAGDATREPSAATEPPAAVEPGPVAADIAPVEALSFGALLVAARERQGMTREHVAARLRLAPRQIEALESLRLDNFPKGPFVRGFVQNYAKELGLDPGPLLADLAQRMAPPALPVVDLGPVALARPVDREPWPRRVVLWGAAVALGVFASIGVFVSRTPTGAPFATPPAPQVEAPRVETPASAEPARQDAKPELETATAPPAPPDLRIVIGARPSWVEVAQADGTVVVSGLQAPGTELSLAGQRPLRLVIGNAGGVIVESRGEPVSLAPHRQSDVARLTLD